MVFSNMPTFFVGNGFETKFKLHTELLIKVQQNTFSKLYISFWT